MLTAAMVGANIGGVSFRYEAYAEEYEVLAGGSGIKYAEYMEINTGYIKEWKYDIEEGINNVDSNSESWYTFEIPDNGLVTLEMETITLSSE